LASLNARGERPEHKLSTRADYGRVYREGRRYVGSNVVLYVRQTDAPLRLGVTAGRKLGGAVRRNRAKRRVREAFRRVRNRLSGRGDIVVVARSGVIGAAFTEILAEIEMLCLAGQLMREREK